MKNTSPSESKQTDPGALKPSHEEGERLAPRYWFLALLDKFLSESLRRASPTELRRYRVMTGAAAFLLLTSALYLPLTPPNQIRVATTGVALGILATLVLLRRATSATAPAVMLCGILTLGTTASMFFGESPNISTHAFIMLLPALTVYLVGPRWGLINTAFLIVILGILRPIHYAAIHSRPFTLTEGQFWLHHLFACVGFLGAWGLGSLHGTAQAAAQASLEHTLNELRDSEGKLNSLIENTDDVVASLDVEGRVLTANTVIRQLYRKGFGKELEVGRPFFDSSTPVLLERWRPRMAQVLQGQRLRLEEEYDLEGSRFVLDISVTPILGAGDRVVGLTFFGRDITARKQAEARLGELHRTLMDISRQAGMAEIATGVLHNVGNTLNSVNVSTSLLAETLRMSRITGLTKAAQLLREHVSDLGHFLTADDRGRRLPDYLIALEEQLTEERSAMNREVYALRESVDHIESIVTMQQKYARTAGTLEQIEVPQLIDEALRLHAISLERLGISIERDYAQVPPALVDRHKLLQILVNLLTNARHALLESATQDKRLKIGIWLTADGQHLIIEVTDNGVGIAPENLPRLFSQGFTTKKTGHGFGLHISALAAADMKGRLTCSSPGPGQGATFTLELPLTSEGESSL